MGFIGAPHERGPYRVEARPRQLEALVTCARHGHGRAVMPLLFARCDSRAAPFATKQRGRLDRRGGSLLVRRGKGGRRREVGVDEWGCQHLQPWARPAPRVSVGSLFSVITGPTRGRPWSAAAVRADLGRSRSRRRAATLGAASAPPTPTRSRCPRGRLGDRHPAPARPTATSASPRSTSKPSTTPRSPPAPRPDGAGQRNAPVVGSTGGGRALVARGVGPRPRMTSE
jgi:hypothetical protein